MARTKQSHRKPTRDIPYTAPRTSDDSEDEDGTFVPAPGPSPAQHAARRYDHGGDTQVVRWEHIETKDITDPELVAPLRHAIAAPHAELRVFLTSASGDTVSITCSAEEKKLTTAELMQRHGIEGKPDDYEVLIGVPITDRALRKAVNGQQEN